MLDGRIARLTGTTSDFGVQFDSLADLISFGMAPAVLAFQWGLVPLGAWGGRSASSIVTAAARAPRAVQHPDARPTSATSSGMPSPAAAGIPAATIFFFPVALQIARTALLALAMLLVPALLMVSTIRFHSFKTLDLGGAANYRRCSSLFAAWLALMVAYTEEVLLAMAYGYLMSAFVGGLLGRRQARGLAGCSGARRYPGDGWLAGPQNLQGCEPRRHRQPHRHAGADAAPARDRDRPPFSSTFRRAIVSPRPVPVAFVEKYGSKIRASADVVHADAGVGDDDRNPALRPRRDADTRSVPPPGIACSAFSMMLVSARAEQHAVDHHRRHGRGDIARDGDASRERQFDRARRPRRTGLAGASAPARGCGDDAKLENSDAIWRSSRTCPRMLATHSSTRVPSGRPRSTCTRRRCSALSWMGVRGFLMSCATCRAMSAHASRRLVRSSWPRCRWRSAAIRLNASTRRRSSSLDRRSRRASRSPRAMRRVARVRRLTGSAMRSAIQ